MNAALKLAIIEAGITQYDLARKLGISESRMSRISCGRIDPTQDERAAMAKALNRSAEHLFGRKS